MSPALIGAVAGLLAVVLLIEVPTVISGEGRYELGDAYLVAPVGALIGAGVGFAVGARRRCR